MDIKTYAKQFHAAPASKPRRETTKKKFDRTAYQREYMRRAREKKKISQANSHLGGMT